MWRAPGNRVVLASLLLSAAVAAPADGLGAQVEARKSRVSVDVGARLIVPVRMVMEPAGPARAVSRDGDQVELEVPFRAGANLHWSATVSLKHVAGDSPAEVSVLTAEGLWVRLRPGQSVQITGRREPSNPAPLLVRVKYRGTAAGLGERLILSIQPAN